MIDVVYLKGNYYKQNNKEQYSVRDCMTVGLYLIVGGLMSYLRYLCLFAYSSVQHILYCVLLCFVCLRLVCPMSPVSLDSPFVFPLRYFLAFI
jgi:hypothetical protein